MTLMELQKIFGDRIEITLREDLSAEERETENEQSALIMQIGKQMINNGDLILRAEKLSAQNRALVESRIMKLIG